MTSNKENDVKIILEEDDLHFKNIEHNSSDINLNNVSSKSRFHDDNHTTDNISTYRRLQTEFNSSRNNYELNSRQGYILNLNAVELIKAKDVISQLETRNATLEISNKRARIEYENEHEISVNEQKQYQEEIEDLQAQLRNLMEKQVQTLETLKETKQSANTAHLTYKDNMQKLQNENIIIKSKFEEQVQVLQEQLGDLKAKNFKSEQMATEASLEVKLLKEKLEIQSRSAQMSQNKVEELLKYKDQYLEANKKLQEFESKDEDHIVLNKILQSQMKLSSDLEKENARLKDENKLLRNEGNTSSMLQEKLIGVERALERAQERCSEMNKLSAMNAELNAKLESWEKLLDSTTAEKKSPHKLSNYIGELQAKEISLLHECGELSTTVNLVAKDKEKMEKKVADAEQELKLKSTKLQMHADLIKRLQKKLLLITKERDSYRNVLNSYEKEVTLNTSSTMSDRIQALEHLLENAHLQISNLEATLEAANSKILDKLDPKRNDEAITVKNLQEQLAAREARNATLQKNVNDLQQINAKLQEEKENLELTLEHKGLKGDYNPLQTKIVHFKMNPIAMAQINYRNELEMMQKENECLKEKINYLQRNKDCNDSSIADDSIKKQLNISANKEIDALKEQLKTADLRHQRFMEAFTEKSQEFREVCYMLFGFRVDMISEHKYKLISMYAERQDDYLLYKLSTKGELQLLETEFSNQVSHLIEMYLQKQHSIPAFLSSLTLDLLVQQTSVSMIPVC